MSGRLCIAHVRRQARSGSAHHESLKGSELAPYRSAAKDWLHANGDDRNARLVIRGLDDLLAIGSRYPWHAGLKGLAPADKARATFGRLSATGVTGAVLLEVGLAVGALVRVRGIIVTKYLYVQVGRVLMRMHAPAPTLGGWRPSEASARTSGRALGMIGRHVWFYAYIVATGEVLDALAQEAQPGVTVAERQEVKRKAKQEVKRRTSDAIARSIVKARTAGYGARDLAEMEASLRRQYGLAPLAKGHRQ